MIVVLMALAMAASSVEVTGADTLRYNGRIYRLYDIDAPQAGALARCRIERTRAEETAAIVRDLVARAERVEIIPGYDPRGRRSWPSDRHDQRLATIKIDGRDLGDLLIAEGRAAPWNNRENHNWCRGPYARAR